MRSKYDKSRSGIRISMLLAVGFFLVGCAITQPVETDREMGQQLAQQVEEEIGTFKDAAKTDYLNDVGRRLVKTLEDQRFNYSFSIVDQPESNAFAAPGGFIFVSRGLLALTNNEEELANVLGHEIIHVSQRHTAQQLAKARAPSLLALPGAIVGSVVGEGVGNLINAPILTLGAAYMAQHSRSDEFEADRLGQQLSARAGYDPAALASILDRLEKEAELRTGQKRRPGFFDTHPTTPDRVGRIEKDAREIEWSPQTGIAPTAPDYLRKMDGLLVGEDPAQGVFRGPKFLQPVLDFSMVFPDGWMAANSPQAVAAFTPKKDAVVMLGIAGKGNDPGQVAKQAVEEVRKKHSVKPTRSEATRIGSIPAYLVTYTDSSGREPMHLFFLYLAYRDLIYQFSGMAPERYRGTIRETAMSFRALTSQERASIMETRMRIVSAGSNESLARLSERTRNVWDLKMTSVVNGIQPDRPLKEGQLIKIAVSQPFKYRR